MDISSCVCLGWLRGHSIYFVLFSFALSMLRIHFYTSSFVFSTAIGHDSTLPRTKEISTKTAQSEYLQGWWDSKSWECNIFVMFVLEAANSFLWAPDLKKMWNTLLSAACPKRTTSSLTSHMLATAVDTAHWKPKIKAQETIRYENNQLLPCPWNLTIGISFAHFPTTLLVCGWEFSRRR